MLRKMDGWMDVHELLTKDWKNRFSGRLLVLQKISGCFEIVLC